jgi:hypothetical protein
MTVLLIIAAWLLSLVMVVGLCAAASLGDRAQSARVQAAGGSHGSRWEFGEPLAVSGRAGAHQSRQADSRFAPAGNAAA